jgi:hypothetical protein
MAAKSWNLDNIVPIAAADRNDIICRRQFHARCSAHLIE